MTTASFKLSSDAKSAPLCPNGTYQGSVSGVKFSDDFSQMIFSVILNGNGGYLSDNETPLDGSSYDFRLYFPKEGDEVNMTGSGRQTKWQWKINQLASFFGKNFADLNIDVFEDMEKAVAERSFIGANVQVEIKIEEYEGTTSSKIKSLTTL